jgi:hypothetical protein
VSIWIEEEIQTKTTNSNKNETNITKGEMLSFHDMCLRKPHQVPAVFRRCPDGFIAPGFAGEFSFRQGGISVHTTDIRANFGIDADLYARRLMFPRCIPQPVVMRLPSWDRFPTRPCLIRLRQTTGSIPTRRMLWAA